MNSSQEIDFQKIYSLAPAFVAVGLNATAKNVFGNNSFGLDISSFIPADAMETRETSIYLELNSTGPIANSFYYDLSQMRKQKSGLIINIGSITGAEGDGNGMDYSTAKAGVMYGLTKSIAQYGARHGIRCVCVSPGPVLTRAAMANMKTLLGRAAEPQEIVDLCLFLASEKGQFINGENIMIDGGRNAMGRWN